MYPCRVTPYVKVIKTIVCSTLFCGVSFLSRGLNCVWIPTQISAAKLMTIELSKTGGKLDGVLQKYFKFTFLLSFYDF